MSLSAFLALDNGEFDTLTFVEGFEAFSDNSIEVNENIAASITLDKAVAFTTIEPFYSTLFFRHDLKLLSIRLDRLRMGSKSKGFSFYQNFCFTSGVV